MSEEMKPWRKGEQCWVTLEEQDTLWIIERDAGKGWYLLGQQMYCQEKNLHRHRLTPRHRRKRDET